MRLPTISSVLLAAAVAIVAGVAFAVAVPLQTDLAENVCSAEMTTAQCEALIAERREALATDDVGKRIGIGLAIGLVVLVVVVSRPRGRPRQPDVEGSPPA